ncbi:uncharacterized protein LOC127799493 [Diospyros lotus]|uniref:uncharacterized protein LOC127799493 n=1 Tax=Diospyros lotus TaxID=55363 RepID=UPI00225BA05C|nr:uncharacterized protein LOC127799493 [Diospyros lotus]
MISSEINKNELGSSGTFVASNRSHSPLIKKMPLRDVQNDNRISEGSRVLEGRPIADATKVIGTKKLTTECPLSPHFDTSMSKNGKNGHLMARQIKFKSESGKGRIQNIMDTSAEFPSKQTQIRDNNLYFTSVFRPNLMSSMMTFPHGGPSVPISLGKPGNGFSAAEFNGIKFSSEVCHPFDPTVTDDQHRQERFLHLQTFLKQCNESSRDYIQMLQSLPPAELSRHAVELEKRAMQLTIEEGKQLQRMKALNVLVKPDPGNSPSPLLTAQAQQPLSNK